jgi:hypothetical protein
MRVGRAATVEATLFDMQTLDAGWRLDEPAPEAGRRRRSGRGTARAATHSPGDDQRLLEAQARIASLEAKVAAQHSLIGRLVADLSAVSTVANQLGADSATAHYRADRIEEAAERADTWAAIAQHEAWAARAPLMSRPLISVVMATRDRSRLARRAIESLLAQCYSYWELEVVDDGSVDDTAAILASFDDQRVHLHRTDGVGSAAARNVGLSAATGELVAFLDDDNLMASGWLRAVAELFGRKPALQIAYGAQLRANEHDASAAPSLLFRRTFERQELLKANFVDLGALVVRAGTPELHFDPALPALQDWDLLLRLSRTTNVEPLPVLAGVYTTDAPNRISRRPDVGAITAMVRDRYRGETDATEAAPLTSVAS